MVVTDVKSTSEFQFYLKNQKAKAVVCLFSVKWCGYCINFRPVFEDLARRHKNYHFINVDVDLLSKLADQMRIQTMPTIYIFKDGKRVKEIFSGDDIAIEEWIQQNSSHSPQHHHQHQKQKAPPPPSITLSSLVRSLARLQFMQNTE